MPGFFSRIKQWIGLDNLTAQNLNAEFNNLLTNLSAPNISGASDYPATLSGMQATENPGNVGTEVLPVTIQDEIRELRFMVQSIVGAAQWYSPPPVNLTQLESEIAGIISLPGSRVISGRTSSQGNNQPSFLVPDGTASTVYLRATATPFDAYFNQSLEEFTTDITVTGLSTAPTSNNTCVVNDSTLSGGVSTLQQGELASSIGIANVGSNITSLAGDFAAFKHSTEYFIAQVENDATYATPTADAGASGLFGTTNTSATIIPASNSTVERILVGMAVSGTGIQNGTVVTEVNFYTVTISLPATASNAAVTLTFLGNSLTNVSSLSGIEVGQLVTGTGVPSGTTVTEFSYDGLTGSCVTLSNTLTAAGTGTYTFKWTRLKNAFRGVGFDNNDAWIARTAVSNGDTITLMKLAWVFATFNSSTPGVLVTYNKPVVSFAQPAGPATGDFWYNLGTSTWEIFNGTSYTTTIACFVGICIQDSTGCKAARSVDFYKVLSQLNTLEPLYLDPTDVYSQSLSSRISVYGNQFYFQNTQPTWNTTSNLDSGQSLTSSTQYYCYVTDQGDLKISAIAPTQRKFDLLGAYHPAKPWRCVATFSTDSGSNVVDTSVSCKDYYQFVLPAQSVSANALALASITTKQLADSSVQSNNLANDSVATANLQSASVTTEKLNGSLALPGNPTYGFPTFNYQFALSNSAEVMIICRGQVSSAGAAVSGFGDGFSASITGSGSTAVYTVTFSSNFSNTPTVVLDQVGTVNVNALAYIKAGSTSVSGFQVYVVNANTGALEQAAFNFIAIGPM